MTDLLFQSNVEIGTALPLYDDPSFIKNEPMLFNADYAFAASNGGKITRAFLCALSKQWDRKEDIIIDSRVHMLMRGWWPCIPGWHHDDVPRKDSDGQPNYENPAYHAEHCMMLVNGGIAPTQFAIGTIRLPEARPGEITYGKWHPLVADAIREGRMSMMSAPDKRLIFFDAHTFHMGVRAERDGWRFFIRASRKTGRKATNEIRSQVQVYLETPHIGW